MNSGDLNMVEARRQELLGQIKAAESALSSGLHTHGFGSTARAHLEHAARTRGIINADPATETRRTREMPAVED